MHAEGSNATEKYVNLGFDKTIISIFPLCLIKVQATVQKHKVKKHKAWSRSLLRIIIKIEYACMFI